MGECIGKYIVEGNLGEGGFGVVKKALDPDLQKFVAIKKLRVRGQPQDGEPQTDTRVLFAKEAQETSKLSHPNIVTVHGFGIDENDGAPYLVMELLDGQTLQKMIASRTPMSMFQRIEIMHQVAEGLQFAHTRGVIHRDIKPANIMVLSDGTAKVMDFAVAPEGFVIGTFDYMAPEQFTSHGVSDAVTDIFAFGAVFYELFTGELAFDHRKDHTSTSHYEPPRLSSRLEGCPAWLDLHIHRAIAKRRDERFSSLEEMLIETRPILQKLKQQQAAKLASGIPALISAGDRDAADQMIARVLRLDPSNRDALALRGNVQAGQREQARARAIELLKQGQGYFDSKEFDQAVKTLEEAGTLDPANPAIERLLEKTKGKAEDRRSAQMLLDEAIEDITGPGPGGMDSWHVENVFKKISRAVQLDPQNAEAEELRNGLLPAYEQVCDRKMAPLSPADSRRSTGVWNLWYERRLKEAIKARKNREYGYAQEILEKLAPDAQDNRVQRELIAVAEDYKAHFAAEEALATARKLRDAQDLPSAIQILDKFAEEHPRQAAMVREMRHTIDRVLNRGLEGDTAE